MTGDKIDETITSAFNKHEFKWLLFQLDQPQFKLKGADKRLPCYNANPCRIIDSDGIA